MAVMDALFNYLKDNDGSDLHLAAGIKPRIRAKGKLRDIEGWDALKHDDLMRMMEEIADEAQWEEYTQTNDLDFAYAIPGVARFRANYFRQQHGAAAIFRIIPAEIIPIEKLNLPPAIEALADLNAGLVLVTGPTGSGKSTTLASIVDKINNNYSYHIVTIEDPVEFVHQNKRCTLSQREVGVDTDSFASALKSAIRQDADVILVGEMRELDTIGLALTAAEMGALVFGTLHTNSAAKTIDRLIDTFPADQQNQVRVSLSESLSAVVSQLLLPTADGKGRCAVNEIMLKSQALPNIIREGNTPMLTSMMQGGKADGMITMDDALMVRVKEGKITAEDAYAKANDKTKFVPLMPQELRPGPNDH